MRILGGHDYYDGALAFGRDETLVFVRSTNEKAKLLKFKETPLVLPRASSLEFENQRSWGRVSEYDDADGTTHSLRPVIVWFAGVRYAGFRDDRRARSHAPLESLWFWDIGKLVEHLSAIGAEIVDGKWMRQRGRDMTPDYVEAFFADRGSKAEIEWLIDNGISIAIMHEERYGSDYLDGWKIDCDGLDAMHFARVSDPYAAFQNLSQWIGGVLPRTGADMVAIRDEKTLLSKHGMDNWSFKRMPGSK